MLNVGWFTSAAGIWRRDDDLDRQLRFPVPAYLIETSAQVVLVDGDHDLLGDGSVELLLTPGHTPGHQSVRVGERLVIGGDVTHCASWLDDHRFPVFADDHAAQAAAAERLRTLRVAGVTVPSRTRPRRPRAGARAGVTECRLNGRSAVLRDNRPPAYCGRKMRAAP